MPKLTDNKINNWKNLIENWDLKESTSLIDGYLKHIVLQNSSSTIVTNVDRRAILFSTVLCLCKAISNDKWKFKDDKNYILAARSEQDKIQWLCLLMYIRNKR
jgi:hypothetical protein